jgi:hypothetical protein
MLLMLKWMFVKLVSQNYYLERRKKYFRQLNGTPIGASISVYFAKTFMYYSTSHLVHRPPMELSYFQRYIDHIVGIWTGEEDDIETAFTDVIDSRIRLTFIKDKSNLAALDVQIRTKYGHISTSLFRKPADTYQFIHWTSAHPTHLKSSIPYSQLQRVRRICSNEEEFAKKATTMLARFRYRGFPERIFQTALSRARGRSRQSLLSDTTRTPGSGLHLVDRRGLFRTFSPKHPRSLQFVF